MANFRLDKLIGQPIEGLSGDMTQEDVITQWRENLEKHIGAGPAHLANALVHLQILKAYLPDDGDAMHITQQAMYSTIKSYRETYPKSPYDPLLAIKFGDSVLDNGDVTETS